jgi:hypothetical protein
VSAELRAVVDVNVFVSAARSPSGLCGRLLDAATAGRWIPVVSVMLFQELEEVLARHCSRRLLVLVSHLRRGGEVVGERRVGYDGDNLVVLDKNAGERAHAACHSLVS